MCTELPFMINIHFLAYFECIFDHLILSWHCCNSWTHPPNPPNKRIFVHEQFVVICQLLFNFITKVEVTMLKINMSYYACHFMPCIILHYFNSNKTMFHFFEFSMNAKLLHCKSALIKPATPSIVTTVTCDYFPAFGRKWQHIKDKLLFEGPNQMWFSDTSIEHCAQQRLFKR